MNERLGETSLKAVQYFMAALIGGSISEAAKQMHVAFSAMLAATNQVEEIFDLLLITRHFVKGIASAATWRIPEARIQPLLDEC